MAKTIKKEQRILPPFIKQVSDIVDKKPIVSNGMLNNLGRIVSKKENTRKILEEEFRKSKGTRKSSNK